MNPTTRVIGAGEKFDNRRLDSVYALGDMVGSEGFLWSANA